MMTHDDHVYHSERERQCRALAQQASDPEIGRRHSELAELHAMRAAALTQGLAASDGAQRLAQ